MSLEIEELSTDSNIFSLIHWAKETALWDGHQVTLEEAPHLKQEIEKKILSILSKSNLSSPAWHSTLANLALLGATDTSRSLIERDIQQLRPLQDNIRVCGSFNKSITKFWKKHKAAILIGAGVAAITTTIIIVTACTGGAAAIPVATTGAALGTPPPKKKEPKKEKPSAPASPSPKPSQPSQKQPPPLPFFPTPELASLDNFFHFTEKSRPFEIEGIKYESQGIGFINGIGTSLEGAKANATHIQKLTPNQHIEGVYNQTHGMITDIAEVLTLNLHGVCPNTGAALSANWKKFHEEHKNNPKAKYLQFCHSGGTIAVKNQLDKLPKEVQKRIIIVTIAPAVIITDERCYKAFNYASKRDVVPFTEPLVNGFLDPNEIKVSEKTKKAIENRKHLILLDPDPNASLLDHEFTSPTFSEVIKKHIDDYSLRNGEYE